MAKKFQLNGLMNEFDEDIQMTNDKKKGRVEVQFPAQKVQSKVPTGKEKGSSWRKNERPIQKTIHFDHELSSKIDLLKGLMNVDGGKVRVEDIVYEATKEYVLKKLEEQKDKLSGMV